MVLDNRFRDQRHVIIRNPALKFLVFLSESPGQGRRTLNSLQVKIAAFLFERHIFSNLSLLKIHKAWMKAVPSRPVLGVRDDTCNVQCKTSHCPS